MASGFLDLIERLRRGDEAATQQLVDDYGDAVRRAIRINLLERRLRRVIGESDLFQSVVTRFLFDLWAGRYEFERPEHLAALLKKMAAARVADVSRHHTAERRDIRRTNGEEAEGLAAEQHGGPTPSQVVANRELLQRALDLMSDTERRILAQRHERLGWKEIAETHGGSPEAVRKRFERALERVASRLAIDAG